jgi:LmbE family N-acetylglucosaminyl deacetylase
MHAKGLVVISPHFDDAVMSCGELIGSCSGVVVATVCSASPGPRVPASPEWDAAEFETAHAAAMSRGEEDRRALAVLGAEQVGLGLVDELYRPFVGHEELLPQLAASIAALLDERRPRVCAFPVGLGTGTSDHELARDAAVHALRPRGWCHPIAYAELPYAFNFPSRLDERLLNFPARVRRFVGPTLRPGVKQDAVRCYETQLQHVPSWERALEPGTERLFHVRWSS